MPCYSCLSILRPFNPQHDFHLACLPRRPDEGVLLRCSSSQMDSRSLWSHGLLPDQGPSLLVINSAFMTNSTIHGGSELGKLKPSRSIQVLWPRCLDLVLTCSYKKRWVVSFYVRSIPLIECRLMGRNQCTIKSSNTIDSKSTQGTRGWILPEDNR